MAKTFRIEPSVNSESGDRLIWVTVHVTEGDYGKAEPKNFAVARVRRWAKDNGFSHPKISRLTSGVSFDGENREAEYRYLYIVTERG